MGLAPTAIPESPLRRYRSLALDDSQRYKIVGHSVRIAEIERLGLAAYGTIHEIVEAENAVADKGLRSC